MRKNLFISLAFMVILLFVLGPVFTAQADLTAQETTLASDGQPWEANLDSQGMLWISHLFPAEIWRINTANEAITVYPVGGGPSDGRGDGSGNLWWADLYSNHLNRLDTSTNQVMRWEIPGSGSLYSTTIDPQGRVWVMDFSDPSLYRIDPSTNEFCTYALPNDGMGNYIEAESHYLWYADTVNTRIVRLDVIGGTFEFWLMPSNSYPLDLTLDGNGILWWTDTDLNNLGRLDPSQDKLTTYGLPGNFDPQMLSIANNQVWFSFQDPGNPGGLGRLDPTMATGTNQSASNTSQAATPTCTILMPVSGGTLTPTISLASWSGQNYTVSYNQDGLLTFQMPENGLPYGIATADQIWLIDQGRSKLAKLSYPAEVSACKLSDADGNLATADDQAPEADWPVYLRFDGVRQEPGKLTGVDGCATWGGLQPGPAYGVEEDTNSWTPLTPTSHDFGTSSAGQTYSFTFINQQANSIYLPLVVRR